MEMTNVPLKWFVIFLTSKNGFYNHKQTVSIT